MTVKKIITLVAIPLLFTACGGGGSDSGSNGKNDGEVDTTSPVLTEVSAILSTVDTAPEYTFSTTEAGNISYTGDCSSTKSAAVEGINTIKFNTLTTGIHDNCEIVVTDSAKNASLPLEVSSFTIESAAPVLSEVSAIGTSLTKTPAYTFNTTKAGVITYGGTCISTFQEAIAGDNTIVFDSLDLGVYTDCTLQLHDAEDNTSNLLTISAFTIELSVDVIAPELTEVINIGTSSKSAPMYTFQTTESGLISLNGSCMTLATNATLGSNTITFSALADGTYSDCELFVTDENGNRSMALAITPFTIDATGPLLTEVAPIGTTYNKTPSYQFTSNEAGTITYGGACASNINSASEGLNQLTFNPLELGGYSNCSIEVTDTLGNAGTLLVTEFFIEPAPDVIAPTLAETQAIGTSVIDKPTYRFSSNEAGVITYQGSCSSTKSTAVEGENSVIFNALANGSYNDCSVQVTDSAGNVSTQLVISPFVIDVPPSSFLFTAWVGRNDTLITFPQDAAGYSLYSSNEKGCDLGNYTSCVNGQLNILDGSTVTDTALSTYETAYYVVKKNSLESAEKSLSAGTFSYDDDNQSVYFKSKFWMIAKGSVESGNSDKASVWNSVDGVNWEQVSSNAPFGARTEYQFIVFKDSLFVIGGYDGTFHSDVWSSQDGITWVERVAAAGFKGRYGHEVFIYDDKLWLTGGYYSDGSNYQYFNDIWSTPDGVSWTQETASADFTERSSTRVIEFKGKLWMYSGMGANDVWSSDDAVSWRLETSSPDFGRKNFLNMQLFNDKLWLVGGSTNGSEKTDVWTSENGIVWNKLTSDIYLTKRKLALFVLDEKLTVIGSNNNKWSTSDGTTWKETSTIPQLTAHHSAAAVVFNEKLWLIGGVENGINSNKIRSSVDGINWQVEVESAPFSARHGHKVIAYNGKLWLYAGYDNSFKQDVWSSDDGINWSEESVTTFPDELRYHQIVEFNGKLWMTGGVNFNESKFHPARVYSSVDGVFWNHEGFPDGMPTRTGHQLLTFNNKLWIIGGYTYTPNIKYLNDIWSSSDGENWVKETESAEFSPRSFHQVVNRGGSLLLTGGYSYNGGDKYYKDTWYSNNGKTWHLDTETSGFAGRAKHNTVLFDNRLMLIGGDRSNSFTSNVNSFNDVWSMTSLSNWRKGYRGEVKF